jgi:outer membrane biosynthesis protein TonB
MSDDLLERAARALREEGDPSDTDLAETRARLTATSRNQAASRVRTLRWVLPLAAAFAAGSAFAATNGQIERAVRAVQTWLQDEHEVAQPVRSAPKRKPKAQLAEPAPTSPPAPLPVLPAEAESAAPEPVLDQPSTPQRQAHASEEREQARGPVRRQERERSQSAPSTSRDTSSSAAPASASTPKAGEEQGDEAAQRVPSPDLALYREAHQAHFTARDYAAALALWDRYLARFEHGIFALEARYNRGICLVRLKRIREAEAALAPFAEGRAPGQYRQREARALLDALTKKP